MLTVLVVFIVIGIGVLIANYFEDLYKEEEAMLNQKARKKATKVVKKKTKVKKKPMPKKKAAKKPAKK